MAQQDREGGDGAVFCQRVNIMSFQGMLYYRTSDESVKLNVKGKRVDHLGNKVHFHLAKSLM